jgi:hypothetical protein
VSRGVAQTSRGSTDSFQKMASCTYAVSPKPIPENVCDTLDCIGHGAVPIFATSYVADDLAQEHDSTSRGERILACELLVHGESMGGNHRSWFSSDRFEALCVQGRAYDIVAVLDAMQNLDVSPYCCYQEGGDDCDGDDAAWESFVEWKEETAQRSRLSVLLKKLHLVLTLKLYTIRFRCRVHAPGGALYSQSAKRFCALSSNNKNITE